MDEIDAAVVPWSTSPDWEDIDAAPVPWSCIQTYDRKKLKMKKHRRQPKNTTKS